MYTDKLYPCPCCGYKTLNAKPPGTYIICPICFWEDDDTPGYFGYRWSKSNQVSLREAQRNFLAFGACEQEWLDDVRTPFYDEVQDSNWQTIDVLEEHTRLALITEITTAFDSVTREDGISLHAAQALDDWNSMEEAQKIGREKDSESRWQDVPDKWIEYFHVFPYFDDKGFRYYIPAYMIWSLKYYETSNSASVSSTIYVLENSDGYYSRHFELFNTTQLQAVEAFLKFMKLAYD
jgi:Cysteine-rich CPCC